MERGKERDKRKLRLSEKERRADNTTMALHVYIARHGVRREEKVAEKTENEDECIGKTPVKFISDLRFSLDLA